MGATRRDLNRQRTVREIEGAFLAAYRKGGVDGVSISGICQQCGISRSTFYQYFEDKFAVLQGVENRLLACLWEICGELPDVADHHDRASDNALRTIAHIRENMGWYQALLGGRGDPMFVHRWKRDIERSLHRKLAGRSAAEEDAVFQGVMFASALIGLYTYVVLERPDISDRQLCRYMDGLLAQMLG